MPESMGSLCRRQQAACRNKTLTAKPEPQNLGEEADMATWDINWAWGLPLIVLTVVIHVLGLGLINERIVTRMGHRVNPTRLTTLFVVIMAAAAMMAAVLHAIEGTIWAAAYLGLGALPDFRKAMLYSLGAITSYGHAAIYLEDRWQMLGALEALNGVILFGLTTAFLFALIQRIWPLGSRMHGGRH
jgi:hypothetical protein